MKRGNDADGLDVRVDLQRAGLAMALVEFRREGGLTQADLAEMTAISQQQLSKVEKGDNCNIITLLRICEAMNLELRCVRKRET